MIKLLCFDEDGCLTDGGYYFFDDHSGTAKKYNTKDFLGLSLLRDAGVETCLVTSSNNETTRNKIKSTSSGNYSWCNIQLIQNVRDKKQAVYEKFGSKFNWDEIAFIGDDLNDIEILKTVGYAACPFDAVEKVKNVIIKRKDSSIMTKCGGAGCVREFCELILEMNTGNK